MTSHFNVKIYMKFLMRLIRGGNTNKEAAALNEALTAFYASVKSEQIANSKLFESLTASKKLLKYVAQCPMTPSDILHRLASDEDIQVRHAVACNINTPLFTLQVISQDKDKTLASSATQNMSTISHITTRCDAARAYIGGNDPDVLDRAVAILKASLEQAILLQRFSCSFGHVIRSSYADSLGIPLTDWAVNSKEDAEDEK